MTAQHKERRSRKERSGWRRSKRVFMMFLKQDEGFAEKRGDRNAEKKMKTRFMDRERRSSNRRRAKRTQPRI